MPNSLHPEFATLLVIPGLHFHVHRRRTQNCNSLTVTTSRRRWLIPALILIAAIGVFVAARGWPFKQEKIRNALEKASVTKVEFGSFHQTYFPPGCTVENIN